MEEDAAGEGVEEKIPLEEEGTAVVVLLAEVVETPALVVIRVHQVDKTDAEAENLQK